MLTTPKQKWQTLNSLIRRAHRARERNTRRFRWAQRMFAYRALRAEIEPAIQAHIRQDEILTNWICRSGTSRHS